MLMQMRTQENGQAKVIDLKVEQGQAYGRLTKDGDWTPIDGGSDLFAPGGDLLGFLVAAENVQVDSGQKTEHQGQKSEVSAHTPLALALAPCVRRLSEPTSADHLYGFADPLHV